MSHCRRKLSSPVVEKAITRIVEIDVNQKHANIIFTVNIVFDSQSQLYDLQGITLVKASFSLEKEANDKWLSPASHWEIAIKIGLGKYTLPVTFLEFVQRSVADNGFLILPIEPNHTALLTTMPHHHRDPFDRLMIAQATAEKLTVVRADEA